MSDLKRQGATVRVLLHLTSSGQYAVGIIESSWSGPVKVNRRLARLRPVDRPGPAPLGVEPSVWQAWCALTSLIREQAGFDPRETL